MVGPYIYWEKLLSTNKGRVLLTAPENDCKLGNVSDPELPLDAANKKYVDEAVAGGGGSGSVVIAASNNIVPEGTGTEEDPIILNVQDVVFTSGDNFLSGTLRTSSEFNDTRVDIRPDQGGIKYKQLKLIEKFDLKRTLDLENEFVKCLAYAEYCGFKLDKGKWLENDKENKKLLKAQENLLSEWIVKNNVKGISKQYGLFGEEISVSINWSSSKQVVELFKGLGVDCRMEKKGETKETVDIKHIEKQKHVSTIIPIYLEYKKIEKQISTYGVKFTKFISQKTGRIHTSFFQIIDTGRLSSSKPNLQNITATEGVRSCFVAEKGNMLSINDFSSQEPRALAGLSKDSNLIDFFYNGDGDIHSFVASKLYTIINGKDTIITKADKFERQVGKVLNLKLNYGGSAYNSFG